MKPGRYPVAWNKEGRMGYKIGYCECGEEVVISFTEIEAMLEAIAPQHAKTIKTLSSLIPKPTIAENAKSWLIRKLGGYTELPIEEQKLYKGEKGYFRD